MKLMLAVLVALAPLIMAQSSSAAPKVVDGRPVEFVQVAKGFDQPVFLVSPPGDPRIFVVEKTGRIKLLDGVGPGAVFLDLSAQVSNDQEQGLLGLAFDHNYASTGRFYVDYTDLRGDTQIVAFKVSADPAVADANSAKMILSIKQPYPNHNGGWIGFGPDGYFYIASGDGGNEGDPKRNGQNTNTLLGKILRIDVNAGDPYAIPPGNPFASGGGAPEIFVYGLRNPWRDSFDGSLLYIGDVGQDNLEEIDAVPLDKAGANLGWNKIEGTACYPLYKKCDPTQFFQPIYVYDHVHDGCSVTGGYVYRGAAIPALDGRYVFGDYCTGEIMTFRPVDGKASDFVSLAGDTRTIGPIQSFGEDSTGELYALLADGEILKLVPAG